MNDSWHRVTGARAGAGETMGRMLPRDRGPAGGLRGATAAVAVAAAAVLPAWILRALTLGERGIPPAGVDLAGACSDLGVALVVAAAALALSRWSRIAAAVPVAAWVLASYANYEHLAALGVPVNLAHAGQILSVTFVRGSALAPSRPATLVVLLAGSSVLAAITARRAESRRAVSMAAAGIVIVAAVAMLVPAPADAAGWRRASFLSDNAAWLFHPANATVPDVLAVRAADLGGEWRIERARAPANVLVLMLESISGGYLADVAAAHGRRPPFPMPQLDRLSRRGLTYTTFLVQQQQTNRGQYALLCGDYPKLLTSAPKMSEGAAGDERRIDCLPAALRDEGYRTVYLQAAPLAYMMKDRFMPRAGFERVLGDAWFEGGYVRNEWGVDDLAFLEQSLAMVEALERDGTPWLLTLMTSGTHHPVKVPEIRPGDGLDALAVLPEGFPRAAGYLDLAVGRFLDALDARGVLDSTMVVLVSDESFGLRDASDDTSQLLGKAWGTLIVLAPGGARGAVDEPFAQMDLAASILDWLGSPSAARFGGRSIFRRYSRPRPLAFANTYLRRVAVLEPPGDLVTCREDFSGCRAWHLPEGGLFGPYRTSRPVTDADVDLVRRLALASMGRQPVGGAFTLVDASPISLDGPGLRPLFGGQFLFLESGSRVDVDVEVRLDGVEGEVVFGQDLVSEDDVKHYYRTFRMRPGERATLRYTFIAPRALDHVECRAWVARARGRDLAIRFPEARLRLAAPAGDPPGLIEREFSLAPAP